MNRSRYPKQKPEIKLGTLQIWVHGRQYPGSLDYWDGNWLNVTAHCGGDGSEVWVTGSMIHLTELNTLREDIEKLYNSLHGRVVLDSMEPNLGIDFEATTRKEIEIKVHLTPDHLRQKHHYYFKVNLDDLQMLIRDLDGILKKYPILIEPSAYDF